MVCWHGEHKRRGERSIKEPQEARRVLIKGCEQVERVTLQLRRLSGLADSEVGARRDDESMIAAVDANVEGCHIDSRMSVVELRVKESRFSVVVIRGGNCTHSSKSEPNHLSNCALLYQQYKHD
jgi:hypothetical protein